MKKFKRSDLVIPISIVIHLCIINGILWLLTPETYLNKINYIYYNFAWLAITYALNYYPTNRKEQFSTNIHKTFQLYIVFGLAYFALFGFTNQSFDSLEYQLLVYALICLCITWYRQKHF